MAQLALRGETIESFGSEDLALRSVPVGSIHPPNLNPGGYGVESTAHNCREHLKKRVADRKHGFQPSFGSSLRHVVVNGQPGGTLSPEDSALQGEPQELAHQVANPVGATRRGGFSNLDLSVVVVLCVLSERMRPAPPYPCALD